MPSKDEQETTVTWTAAGTVQFFSAVPKHLRRLRANPNAVQVKGDEEWGIFDVPAANYDPITGFKRTRRDLSPEQKAAASARLAEARDKKATIKEIDDGNRNEHGRVPTSEGASATGLVSGEAAE